ncbi:MAG: hypothetical protein VB140_00115 [Burkholderia sp.]
MQTSEIRNPFVSPKIMPVGAIASSRSIYATTPRRTSPSKPSIFSWMISKEQWIY